MKTKTPIKYIFSLFCVLALLLQSSAVFAQGAEEPTPPNAPPVFSFLEPQEDISLTQGEPLTIAWSDEDAEDSAFISLAYDVDDDPANDTNPLWIVQNLPEDSDEEGDTFVWDTTGIPAGTYHLWAVINDSVNPPVYVTADVLLTIGEAQTPSEEPTQEPTSIPTQEPPSLPTEEPTPVPTEEPTLEPTEAPTEAPTQEPTAVPSEVPPREPMPMPLPSEEPTQKPTPKPTQKPTKEPIHFPTYREAAHLSADGLTAYYAVPPLVVLADPNPATQGVKVPQAPEVAAAIADPRNASATFSITYATAGQKDPWDAVCQTFPASHGSF